MSSGNSPNKYRNLSRKYFSKLLLSFPTKDENAPVMTAIMSIIAKGIPFFITAAIVIITCRVFLKTRIYRSIRIQSKAINPYKLSYGSYSPSIFTRKSPTYLKVRADARISITRSMADDFRLIISTTSCRFEIHAYINAYITVQSAETPVATIIISGILIWSAISSSRSITYTHIVAVYKR